MNLSNRYREYIDCLNRRDLASLGLYVSTSVVHNGNRLGLKGYQKMLAGNYEQIPDLRFNIQLLVAQGPNVAASLLFDCHPKAKFLGLDVNGRNVVFNENVFYRYEDEKIREVWSVIDKGRIEEILGCANE